VSRRFPVTFGYSVDAPLDMVIKLSAEVEGLADWFLVYVGITGRI
jgi:hypothetical protein